MLLFKIWGTLVVLMLPFRILFDYSEIHWFDTVKHKIVERIMGFMVGSIVGLFFVMILIQIWSW